MVLFSTNDEIIKKQHMGKFPVHFTGLDGLDELLGEVYMPGPSVGLGCQPPPQMITSLEEDEEMRQLILQDAAPPANDKEDCDNANANNKPDWHSRPSQQSWSAPLPSGIHSAYRNTSIASSASTTTTTSTSSSSTDNAAASHLSSSCGSQSSSAAGGGSSLFGELQQVVFNSLIASLES